jgi:hypothetical protein
VYLATMPPMQMPALTSAQHYQDYCIHVSHDSDLYMTYMAIQW